MLRFAIRDVLWLTVVAAMGVGWWLHVRSIRIEQMKFAEEMRLQALGTVHEAFDALSESFADGLKSFSEPKQQAPGSPPAATPNRP